MSSIAKQQFDYSVVYNTLRNVVSRHYSGKIVTSSDLLKLDANFNNMVKQYRIVTLFDMTRYIRDWDLRNLIERCRENGVETIYILDIVDQQTKHSFQNYECTIGNKYRSPVQIINIMRDNVHIENYQIVDFRGMSLEIDYASCRITEIKSFIDFLQQYHVLKISF